METRDARIVWRAGSSGFERRAVLVDAADTVLFEGRVIPYSFALDDRATDARAASTRDVTTWASEHGVRIVDPLAAAGPWAARMFRHRERRTRRPMVRGR